MLKYIFLVPLMMMGLTAFGQTDSSFFIFPDSSGWNVLRENEVLSFQLKSAYADSVEFGLEGAEGLEIKFDSIGYFNWNPSFNLVDRVSKTKDFTVVFTAELKNGKREKQPVTFTVNHVNQPPHIEELPIFYVRQSNANTFQIPGEYVYDADGDPLVFKSIPSQMPEGASLSSIGQFSWTPSRTQFAQLKNNPLLVEFIVQDQPDKAEARGRIRIAQTQQDLPSEILIVPGDSLFLIKEDETINLKIYISDPNGDDNVRSTGFIPSDVRVPTQSLKENTHLQYEFTWMPGYDFVDDTQTALTTEVTFFVLDKSNNRTQKKIKIKVAETENLVKKDALQFQKYRSNLVEAYLLIEQLDVNQRALNQDYKKAKKGKKNRSIVNASLGAVTGFTPVFVEGDQSKVVSGIGGTTVLTLGTLEATEVIGRSKENILEKIKIGIDIRNRVQSQGDEFARKYALKSARRTYEFEKDIEKFRTVLNDQRIVLLELDAYSKNAAKVSDRDLKKGFVDYADDGR
ncbi:hypothetical protein [Chryseolinea sp. H1M3-3]|uniref:hypothetical protein n=1 Tax=Chryseolinea sp. H1M3-3 TaxID=3034144 RepID=UPI0023EB3BF9|nr:hypothetical protein [Chryseolinea sp. H1M3-3]